MGMDVPRTREDLRDDLESIRDQITDGIEQGRYSLSQLQEALKSRTRQAAESTDQMVHDNPWAALGIGVVLGIMIGYLLPRR